MLQLINLPQEYRITELLGHLLLSGFGSLPARHRNCSLICFATLMLDIPPCGSYWRCVQRCYPHSGAVHKCRGSMMLTKTKKQPSRTCFVAPRMPTAEILPSLAISSVQLNSAYSTAVIAFLQLPCQKW